MCGIGGVVGDCAWDRGALERMARVMTHRGPDGEGIWQGENVGLAFRRLAIIDLDERSNQPQHLERMHLVFNGEIYNYIELREELRRLGHRFETEGDGEVLLHAWAQWGEQALDRLNGMFALAVWDEQERRLVLATDPFAEKPLYFHERRSGLIFASDVRALQAADAGLGAPDEEVVAPFLALGETPVLPRTFFAGVRRLPPAHVAVWDERGLRIRRYWNPRRVEVPRSPAETAEELRALLLDSIRLRLRSDVPVGTSLSGGIDSSVVVGLSAHLAGDHRRHAFTATFPGFQRDEWSYASIVARDARVVEHHAVRPTQDEFLRDLGRVVRDQEEPFGTTSIYAQWRVMQAAREAGITVLLDGQGADELFAGYTSMNVWALRGLGLRSAVKGLVHDPHLARQFAATYYSGRLPPALARRRSRRRASPYVSARVVETLTAQPQPAPDWEVAGPPLRRELMSQAFRTLLPDICRFADKNSMAHSVEVRLPFLDRRVAEFAFSLPSELLIQDGISKRVLRKAVTGIAPDEVLRRRDKIAYATPEQEWLNAPEFRRHAIEVLSDASVTDADRYAVSELERDSRVGRWRDLRGVWRAVNTELWLRAFAPQPAKARR